MTEIFAKTPFSAKMTGHKMLLVKVNGADQNIPIYFLGNGHRGVFWATRSSYMIFLPTKVHCSRLEQYWPYRLKIQFLNKF